MFEPEIELARLHDTLGETTHCCFSARAENGERLMCGGQNRDLGDLRELF